MWPRNDPFFELSQWEARKAFWRNKRVDFSHTNALTRIWTHWNYTLWHLIDYYRASGTMNKLSYAYVLLAIIASVSAQPPTVAPTGCDVTKVCGGPLKVAGKIRGALRNCLTWRIYAFDFLRASWLKLTNHLYFCSFCSHCTQRNQWWTRGFLCMRMLERYPYCSEQRWNHHNSSERRTCCCTCCSTWYYPRFCTFCFQ